MAAGAANALSGRFRRPDESGNVRRRRLTLPHLPPIRFALRWTVRSHATS